MADPSLTLARRLYARKHRIPLRLAYGSLVVSTTDAGHTWAIEVRAHPLSGIDNSEMAATARTERAAVRALCRALGWRP